MEEDYYSDENEKVDSKVRIHFANKLKNIIENAKDSVKDYMKTIVYLTQNQLNAVYKGKPTILNLRVNINKPNTNIFDFLTKDRSHIPSILYLFPDQLTQIIFPHGSSTKTVRIMLTKKLLKDTLKETTKVNKKIDSLYEDLKNKNKIFNNLLEEHYNNFIQNLMKYSSKTPMLTSRKQNVAKVIKSLLEQTKVIDKYYQTLVNIDLTDLKAFLEKCIEGKTKGGFKIDIYGSNIKTKNKIFPFVLFLTSKQKKQLKIISEFLPMMELTLSNTQFHKTCFATILLNRNIYHLSKFDTLPPPPKIKRISTPLAIEMKNLIDFDEPVSTPKPKSVIIPTSKPDLIPTSKQKPLNKLMEKNLLEFNKDPYKKFIPKQKVNNNLQTDVVKALIREINYPLTQDVLGLKLSKDLKEKINKLNTEAVIGLSWIIRALVENNKKKLNVYYYNNNFYQLNKKQIKEIVEYYFNSLALLLNPTQKY